jgi:colanic acid/amylovoran biosynthesis glycosyltransferase
MRRQARNGPPRIGPPRIVPPRIVLAVTDFPSLSETFIATKALGLLEAGVELRIARTRKSADVPGLLSAAERRRLRGRVATAWRRRPRWLAAALLPLAAVRCLVGNPGGTWRYLCRGWRHSGVRVLRDLYRDAHLVALDPDLLHFEFAALAAERPEIGERLGCRMTCSLRGYDVAEAGAGDPDHYLATWRALDAVHVLGEHLRRTAAERGLPASLPVYAIPPAVDATLCSPLGPDHTDPAGPLLLLSVGRAHWSKGYEYALTAARLLADAGLDFRYRIVGGGAGLAALSLARYQLGLEDRVELLGPVPPAEVRRELEQCDLFVHAAVTEGFGNAVLEAQAAARAVVASDAGGLPENVEADVTALVVPRRDPAAMAAAILTLAADPERRREMGRRGRERVTARFSPARQIAAFRAMHEEVLRR